jgi:hypothetical protein
MTASQQSRAGMPDEGLGIAAIGLEHFKAAVPVTSVILIRLAPRLLKPLMHHFFDCNLETGRSFAHAIT